MEVICQNCNIFFHKKPHRILRSKKHFCSTNCHFEQLKKDSTKTEVECDFCGKKHYKNKSCLNRNSRYFCSKICMKSKIILQCKMCSKEFRKAGYHDNYGMCRNCYIKDYYKKNPDKLEKKRSINRIRQRIKNGTPIDIPIRPKKNTKGYLDSSGYKIVYKDVTANTWECGRIHEHVWIMSHFLGRPLTDKETVHHKNGIRDDNQIENLELWSSSHPPGQRVSDKIKFYKEFLESYGAKVDLKDMEFFLHHSI
jgi:hypothetical protein